jgi:hypothetical protein
MCGTPLAIESNHPYGLHEKYPVIIWYSGKTGVIKTGEGMR